MSLDDQRPTTTEKRRAFRAMMGARCAVIAPGAGNALTARMIEGAGFDACYVTGAGIANTYLGAPDVGLVTMTELVGTVGAIGEVCTLPLIVDIDTGFGNAVNAHRTMRALERLGICAVQMEDQVFPKKCGHFSGKDVVPLAQMVAKVRAVSEARENDDTLVIARTDARAVHGLDAALERAGRFVEAGADMTFVEAPVDEAEMRAIAGLGVPQVANMVVGGRTPLLPRETLAQMGFALVLYANAPLQAAMRAMDDVLAALHRDGGVEAVRDRLAGFDERQRFVDKGFYDALEARYREDDT